MRSKFGILFVLMLSASLGGCASLMNFLEIEQKGSAAPDSFCLIAEPITFDRLKDTDLTIEQVKEHNAVGKRLCRWGKSATK